MFLTTIALTQSFMESCSPVEIVSKLSTVNVVSEILEVAMRVLHDLAETVSAQGHAVI